MNFEKLKSFCSKDQSRPQITEPFSDEHATYFTDGRIIVRVPRVASVDITREPDRVEILKKMQSYFEKDPSAGIFNELPAEPESGWGEDCETCGGSGRACKVVCDCCGNETILPVEIDCLDCDGAGMKYWDIRVQVGNQDVNAFYLRKIKDLPGIKIACNQTDPGGVLSFFFTVGDGRLMPMKPKPANP